MTAKATIQTMPLKWELRIEHRPQPGGQANKLVAGASTQFLASGGPFGRGLLRPPQTDDAFHAFISPAEISIATVLCQRAPHVLAMEFVKHAEAIMSLG
jgi:hypothetical protein